MIIKGSNQPIILETDDSVSLITKLSCVLYNRESELKKWSLDTAILDGNSISLTLTEEETLNFPSCIAELEVKWLENGNVEFAEIMKISIVDRKDTTKLIGADE